VFRFKVAADRGFYVRSLARDIARSLGSLGFVSMLRRTKSGAFGLGRSITLDKLASMLDNAGLHDARAKDFCLDISQSLDGIPAVDVTEGQEARIRNGAPVPSDCGDFPVLLVKCRGAPVAIAKSGKGMLFPVRIF
jgi:tRNA pseudouridine55 synthase